MSQEFYEFGNAFIEIVGVMFLGSCITISIVWGIQIFLKKYKNYQENGTWWGADGS